jgi:undecaprenyl-diphosphatase
MQNGVKRLVISVHAGLAHAILATTTSTTTSLTVAQVIILALLQGVAELFPISSLGHTVIVPQLLGWHIDQSANSFLPFVVTLHLGTALALVVYFWRDWAAILTPMLRSVTRGAMGNSPEEQLGWRVMVGTVPVAIIAVLLEKTVQNLLASPKVAALFLIVNGVILLLGERLRVRAGSFSLAGSGISDQERAPKPIETLTWMEAFWVGAAQSLALIPGISRSGVTMVAGMAAGLTHEAAARFAFLLATPIILAAALVEVPTLFDPANSAILGDAIFGGCLSAIAAYFSVRFLMRYFHVGRLDPFAYYCWAAGILSLIILFIRG